MSGIIGDPLFNMNFQVRLGARERESPGPT